MDRRDGSPIMAFVGLPQRQTTTLLRAMALIDPPTFGTVRLDDQCYDFADGRQTEFAPPWPDVMVVFQQFFLWPHMTLRRNITLPLDKRGRKCP